MLEMPIQNRLKVLIAEKEIRENRKLSYRTIADETGISLSIISSYVSQKVNRFDGQTLEKLCRYFVVQPGDLLIFSDDPPAPKKKK
jgi:putative transcriptional regulator